MRHDQYAHINIAVSSCLAGEPVRYDGTSKTNSIITNQLSETFKLHLVCPEMAIGLGVPRKPIKIIVDNNDSDRLNLVDRTDLSLNYTNRMLSYAKQELKMFSGLCGYVVKERSPSCGLLSTERYSIDNKVISLGNGLFTEQILFNFPWLPIISEVELELICQRDNFFERIFISHLWHSIDKTNNGYDKFTNMIKHQIELRGVVLTDEIKADISKIMLILKTTVTLDMQINFLKTILQRYSLNSGHMTTVLSSYQHRDTSLWNVIQQFQKMFENNSINITSNYFYPDSRERHCRVDYFE